MKRLFIKQGSSDRFQSADPSRLGQLDTNDLLWLDLEGEDQETISRICGQFGFPVQALQQGADNYLPRVREAESSIHIVLRAPVIGADDRLDSTQVDLLISEHALVTIHNEPLMSIEMLADVNNLNATQARTPTELAALISQAVGRQVLPLLEELEIRIDGLEELAFAADPRTLTEVHALRRDVLTLRRMAGPQREVMGELSTSLHGFVGPDGQKAFKNVFDQGIRIVDSLESARSLLNSVLETYRGAVADQTNEIVRLLTVFSAILLPLALIASIFGMNFDIIPTTTQTWGFWVWIGAMALIAVGLWTYFARRGFVGGPKLRELPKAVGLGIVQVGTAPVRVLASGVGSTIHHLDKLINPNTETLPDGDTDSEP